MGYAAARSLRRRRLVAGSSSSGGRHEYFTISTSDITTSRGYREELERGGTSRLPRMFGFQAAGSAPISDSQRQKSQQVVDQIKG